MKKILIVFTLFVPLLCFGQITLKTKIDSINYDLAYTKYNLYKFHSQHQMGTIFTITGNYIIGSWQFKTSLGLEKNNWENQRKEEHTKDIY